ncbi:OB-fold domain-containing protein [Actinomadura sp. PM05-2]|uniref:OB-fold domain-containing protein n=2 Tax=Actinomadura parmotrematis TaxID=2864039 RepID=A0ABS7FVM0_9ACTN|nr:OB-fold domain-containing protein [Actinomadura parmotrematis]
MIRNWTQALGDPGAWDDAAPPAMIQVWSMPGLSRAKGPSVADDPLRMLNEHGYTGVVATNCEQTYDRYLKIGEALTSRMRFGGIAGPKKTAMGEGYFVTWYQSWYDENDERVAEMLFRILKFQPRQRAGGAKAKPQAGGRYPLRPAIGKDTQFYWDGVDAGELRIQKCADCGALRHPPGPMCPQCHSTERTYAVASGHGTVHSYVVHHHPPVPGRTPPYVVAVVELDEGVRVVGNVNGCPVEDVRVGMPVRLIFERMDDELTLPQWTPEGAPDPAPAPEPAAAPDGRRVELTPTFVIATALATRDFTPVHHDVAIAKAQGSKDIFVNILTTMGLVQRCALDLAPGAVLESIAVRLGAPAYAGDVLTVTGERVDDRTITVRGTVSLGDHVTATVRLKGDA